MLALLVAEEDALDEFCHVCGKSEEGDVLLLCDGCDNGCHLTCCNPPLKHIPKGDWFCKECFEKQQEITARYEKFNFDQYTELTHMLWG